eukprot:1627885-Rhodomonas_salina.1
MSFQEGPGLCMAMRGPVVVDPTELDHSPRPEAVRHVRRLHHAANVFLDDAHCSLRPCLHCVVVPCTGSGAHGDAAGITPHLECLAPSEDGRIVHPDLADFHTCVSQELVENLFRVG